MMTKKAVLSLIKKSGARVFVYCPLTQDDGMYFETTKAEAFFRLNPFPEDVKIKCHQRRGDVYIG